MVVLSHKTFDELVRYDGGPCISIHCPFDARHRNDRRDHLLLKTLIASTRPRLEPRRRPEIDELLAPAEAVLERSSIGRHSGSICVFSAPGFARVVAVDVVVAPLAVVADRFEVASLVPALERGLRSYVLTVGAENVGLSLVNDVGWEACAVPDLPRSVDDALWYEKTERYAGAHGGAPSGRGGSLIRHGSGAQNEDRKRRLARFLRLVDDRVLAYLAHAQAPLVIAGTAPVVAIYEQVSRHPNLVPAPIGSPEELTPAELHQKVDEVIDAAQADVNSRAVAQFAQRAGTGLASGDLGELLDAAATARIATLLIASTSPVWGSVRDPGRVLPQWQEGSEDLVNRIVVDARRSGAQLRMVNALPGRLPLAGLFRH